MFVYVTIPHPTQRGKVLAITAKPGSHWRCNSETEKAFEMIGGQSWRGPIDPPADFMHGVQQAYKCDNYAPELSAFTLSSAQARDLALILNAGFRPAYGSSAQWPTVDPEDRLFWHPEHDGDEFTREQALAIIGTPKRCTRTAEFDFGAIALAEAA